MPTQEETTTQSQAQRAAAPKQNQNVEQKIQKLRELYADAPELGKTALENGLRDFKQELTAATASQSGPHSLVRIDVRSRNVCSSGAWRARTSPVR